MRSVILRVTFTILGAVIIVSAAESSEQQDVDDDVVLLQASAVKATKKPVAMVASAPPTSSSCCSAAEGGCLLQGGIDGRLIDIDTGPMPYNGKSTQTTITNEGEALLSGEPPPTTVVTSTAVPEERFATVLFRTTLRMLILFLFADGMWRLAHGRRERKRGESTSASLAGQLRHSALAGDAKRCEMLINEGAALEQEDVWGSTPLHAASASGCAPAVRLLLAHGVAVDPRDAIDETPLHVAARRGHVGSCELLLAYGADINALNSKGQTPLVLSAAEAEQMATCELLLGRGAGVGMLSDESLPPALASLLAQEVLRGGNDGALLLGAFADQADWDFEMKCLSCGGRFFSSNDECMACGALFERQA